MIVHKIEPLEIEIEKKPTHTRTHSLNCEHTISYAKYRMIFVSLCLLFRSQSVFIKVCVCVCDRMLFFLCCFNVIFSCSLPLSSLHYTHCCRRLHRSSAVLLLLTCHYLYYYTAFRIDSPIWLLTIRYVYIRHVRTVFPLVFNSCFVLPVSLCLSISRTIPLSYDVCTFVHI